MLILFVLFGCADELETSACDALEGDVHALTPSIESGLEEATAQFHVADHLHVVDLDGTGWIWAPGNAADVTIYTDATLSETLLDGEAQQFESGGANGQCADAFPNSYTLTMSEGAWEFLVEGSGTFDWIALSESTDDGHDHGDHDH